MCNMFRTLTAGEIECRVAQAGKTGEKVWCSILIYKDARVDQKLLDEVIGPMNWKNEYSIIDGNLYCTVSIWDNEKKEWISKQNVGTESNTEKEKGQASDAFKRACFNLGIGRELYTAPKIFIDLVRGEFREDGGKIKCTAGFFVKEIGYNDAREINRLVIVDRNDKVRFQMGAKQKPAAVEKTYVSDDGRKLTEGSATWKKAAQRVAKGETCQDGTPLSVQIAEYYNVPADAMSRFFDLVNEYKSNNSLQELMN